MLDDTAETPPVREYPQAGGQMGIIVSERKKKKQGAILEGIRMH